MPKIVAVNGLGNVQFPDDMPDSAINGEIVKALNNLQGQKIQQLNASPTQFEKDRDPSNQPGIIRSGLQTLGGMLRPGGVNPYPGMDLDAKQAVAQQGVEDFKRRIAEKRGLPYALTAGIAGAVADVSGMERAGDVGNARGVIGHAAGSVAPLAIAETARIAGPKLADLLPSAERAGAKFQQVQAAAGDLPVDVNAAGEHALRIKELADRGSTLPKVINRFLQRTTDPTAGPMTYSEARDFASNASALTPEEITSLKPKVRREVGLFAKKLNESVGQTASAAGEGDNYQSAMSEYRQAMKLRGYSDKAIDVLWNAVKHGGAIGGGAYAVKKIVGH